MLDAGARTGRRSARSATAVAVDARAPKFDGGIVTRARLRPARHRRQHARASASTTRARTSGRSATPSGDAWSRSSPIRSRTRSSTRRSIGKFMPSVFPPIAARSIRELASLLEPAADGARGDRRARSTPPCGPGTFDHSVLDDCRTEGLAPDKTHWAQPHRHAAVLRLSAAAGDHVHLPRREGGRARAGADARRRAARNVFAAARSWRATFSARATSPASA